ncbi:MAG: flagellar biosynthesis regulator FlaF [Candidatus Pacebacteria bacterium]|nr:flagellar biosynthesis regulator FlaF [Candidatus Paceibacterota bacterium]
MSNPQPQGVNAYQQTTSAAKTPRELEREIIARVTHQLKLAKEKRKDSILVARAVSDNLSLWYVMISDLASEGNQLPLEIRGNLISVGMAVVRECEQVDRTKVNLDFLITVNQSMIEGLA